MNPLWTLAVQNGDQIRLWPFIGLGVALVALVILLLLPRKNKNNDNE